MPNPLESWFASRGWKPFPYQRQTWKAFRQGKSGLVHAPTGVGKTLAVWGGPLLDALASHGAANKPSVTPVTSPTTIQNTPRSQRQSHTPLACKRRTTRAGGPTAANGCRLSLPGGPTAATAVKVHTLWVTPLRALAADTADALREPLDDLGLTLCSVGIRTGDTSQKIRAQQKKQLPTVLVTTPESLSLLLSYPETREQLSTLKTVVVDEWHELLASKRGVQTELALARLRSWFPHLRTWGLSATIGNLQQAKDVLLGPEHAEAGVIVQGKAPKKIEVATLIPPEMDRFPWSGHLGTTMVRQVVKQIEQADTTLLFTNTRSQTEIWFQSIVAANPALEPDLAMHHGSLSRKIRREVESRLATGTVKCVVCTSSLDLGVDFSPVDQVLQVGSPKGIARLIQRAGRSGHQPGAISRVVGVPTHAFELIEFAAARDCVKTKSIEDRVPLELSLDVLVQHLVTVACGTGFIPGDLLAEIKTTHAFKNITAQEWQWCLDFITHGGPALKAYPDYKKVVQHPDTASWHIATPRLAHIHRMNIGTITTDQSISIQYLNGRKLGTVEEWFVSRMKPGDQFVFAGKKLELVHFHELTAHVRAPKKRKGRQIPQWMGAKFPLSTELAAAVNRKMLEAVKVGQASSLSSQDAPPHGGQSATQSPKIRPPKTPKFKDPELRAARDILALQQAWSHIPHPHELLIETTHTKDGFHAFVYPFAGRLVHEGLSALCAYRLSRESPRTLQTSFTDYGFEIHAPEDFPADEETWRELFRSDTLLPDLIDCMNVAELARRQFREISRVAGLVIENFPGPKRTKRNLQASTALLYNVFRQYDPDNLLLAQAQREILERQLEMTRLQSTLDKAARQNLVLVYTQNLTPLSFPLWAQRINTESVSTEKFTTRLTKMLADLEQAATTPQPPEITTAAQP
jgi:ATP-dependent Lhr-like helicase